MAVRTEAYEILRGYHELNLKYHLLHELPGDYNKDLSLHLTKQDVLSTTVYIVTEYRISIRCAGKKYVRNAFPFGNMEIGGDKIPNENSMWRNVGKEREAVPHEIWKRTRLISFLTMALLALSIIVNLFIHSTVLTIVCFAAGVGAFIWNTINVRNKTSDVERETDETIAQYQTKYRTWRLGLLNNKLTSLGLAPITDMEGGAKV